MDNLRSHEDIQCPANHQIRFLPPYSPFLNAIENVFAVVKANVKRDLAARRVEFYQLLQAAQVLDENTADVRRQFVSEIIESSLMLNVTPLLVTNCDAHVHAYLPDCLAENEIWI